jgi:hypothetical protein
MFDIEPLIYGEEITLGTVENPIGKSLQVRITNIGTDPVLITQTDASTNTVMGTFTVIPKEVAIVRKTLVTDTFQCNTVTANVLICPVGSRLLVHDPDVTAWVAEVVSNGGTVSNNRRQLVDRFVAAEKLSGAWSLTDDYWALWGEDSVQALTSLKQRRLATAINSPTFTADRGYAFDGVTNYVNTSFVPSTHAIAMTGTNLRIAVYERTNLSLTGVFAAGTRNGSTQIFRLNPRRASTGTMQASVNHNPDFGGVVPNSRGYSSAGFNGSIYEYKNGVFVDPGPTGTTGTLLCTHPISIGAYNNLGVIAGFRGASEGFVAVGATLTAAQELAQYTAVQAWATSIGANV